MSIHVTFDSSLDAQQAVAGLESRVEYLRDRLALLERIRGEHTATPDDSERLHAAAILYAERALVAIRAGLYDPVEPCWVPSHTVCDGAHGAVQV